MGLIGCVRSNSSCVNDQCFYSRVNRLIDPSMLEDLLDRSPKSYYLAPINHNPFTLVNFSNTPVVTFL
jgi:hypothetical protein